MDLCVYKLKLGTVSDWSSIKKNNDHWRWLIHKTNIIGLLLLEVRRQIPKITTDDHYYQSVAAMTRCKLVALKFLSTHCIDFRRIDETNLTHLRFETRHTLSSMSQKPNLLSWDQEGNASRGEFHETDIDRTHFSTLFGPRQR